LRQVEDILHERGIDICHETIRYWWSKFGTLFAREMKKKAPQPHSNWRWHIDEVFVRINGKRIIYGAQLITKERFWIAMFRKNATERLRVKFLQNL
tara:strand:+ start:7528 stop:7815 length:288 start_codon:yes stop_codon:yes gene_type:complete